MEVKDCFVIMPFSTSKSNTEEKWTEIFEKLFREAWGAFGIDCFRTEVPRGSITKDIIEKLYSASVVFADLTDSNPNVMYELGVRHSFKKPSVMVKAKDTVIPFDVNDYRVFEYDYTPKGLEDLKEHIKTVIQDIIKYPNKSDNPVWDFMNISNFIVDEYKKTENIQKLEALSQEFANNLERCIEFLKVNSGVETSRRAALDSNMAFYPNIRIDALTHWRVTQYVNFSDEGRKTLNKIEDFYGFCQVCSSNLAVYIIDEQDRKRISEMEETIKAGIDTVNKRTQELLELK